MDITVGDALRNIIEFPEPVILKLFTGCPFGHLIQQALNIMCRMLIMLTFIGIVPHFTAAASLGDTFRLLVGQTSGLVFGYLLFPRGMSGRKRFAVARTWYTGRRCPGRFRIRLIFVHGATTFLCIIVLAAVLSGTGSFLRFGVICSGRGLLKLGHCSHPFSGRSCGAARSRYWRAAALSRFRSASQHLQDLRKRFGHRFVGACRFCRFLPRLAEVQKLFNVIPATNQHEVHSLEPILAGRIHNGCIQFMDHSINNLDPFIGERRGAIFYFSEFHI